jgi:hypothetical protein
MTRVTIGLEVDLNVDSSTYGMEMSLGVGQGPTTFTIAPHADPGSPAARFSLSDLIQKMGQFLKIHALEDISGWVKKVPAPFDKIFKVEIEPEIQVSIDKGKGDEGSPAGIRCIFKLYDGARYGVRLPGPDLPSWLTIEPDFTVYQLIIGYSSGEGLGINALVEFHDRVSGPDQIKMLEAKGKESEPTEGKKEIISYPFLPAQKKPPLFQVCYVGLGQRFGPTANMDKPDPIRSMFDELRNNLTSNNPQEVLKKVATYYDANRGWFIAADIIVQGWRVRFVFNDPVLYGLEITCNANQFKGLLIEILYQKLGPHLGVYYGALQLPESMRTIQFEYGSVTIPSFRIWIYTNGDFKVAVGWPLGENSIGVQVLVFTGGGGFYFAKLRSGDNPQNPKQLPAVSGERAPAEPDYNPILAFGLGMWLGLGRSIHAGVLSAEVSLTLQGTFQGIIAWKSPSDDQSASLSNPPDYYWFAATVGIVGVLQGEVDLTVISAGILVRLSVITGIAFEREYGTEVTVTASVYVEAHVKIVFVKISIHFRKSFSFGFTLISSPQGYASIDGPINPSFQGVVPKELPEKALELPRLEEYIDPGAIQQYLASNDDITLDVYFLLQPSGVYTESGGALNGVAMLLVPVPNADESPRAASDDDDQSSLAKFYIAYAKWLLRTYSPEQHRWQEVVTALRGANGSKPDDFDEQLVRFICDEIVFLLHPIDLTQTASEIHMAVFPMFAELQMAYSGSDTPIDFAECTTPPNYSAAVRKYFEQLSLNGLMGNPSPTQLPKSLPVVELLGPSVTQFMFFDYFLMIGRDLAGYLADRQSKVKLRPGTAVSEAIPLPDAKMAGHVSGLVSRFFWNALRLPQPGSIASGDPYQFQMESAYSLTGQQFVVDSSEKVCQATLSVAHPESSLSSRIQFARVDQAKEDDQPTSVTSCMPVQALPPSPPAPHWSSQTLQMLAKMVRAAEVHVAQMPGVYSKPAWYTLPRPLQWHVPSKTQAQGADYTYLVPLPSDLVQQAKKQPLNLQVSLQSPEENGDASPQGLQEATISYTPSLFIQLKISSTFKTQNINVTSDGQPVQQKLKKIYQLYTTDDETREMIEQALNSDQLSDASISLLYNAKHSGYQSDNLELQQHPVFINKTNLSTLSQPDDMLTHFIKTISKGDDDDLGPTSAMLDNVEGFLRLVWEVSVVNAPGFYLHYEDAAGNELDDSLFTNGTTDLVILVEFAENAPVSNFHNFIKITNAEAITNSVFIGASYQAQGKPQSVLQYNPAFPAGCVGFEIDWRLQTEKLAQADVDVPLYSDDYFSQLYHLIQFQVQKTDVPDRPSFKKSLWSMALTSSSDQSDEQHQTYKQVVPVYSFVDDGNGGEPLYYDAVGGEPQLMMRLMDIFGNHLEMAPYTVSFPVLYHDRIVSVDEWPGVASTYLFNLNAEQKPVLRLYLNFNPESIASNGASNIANNSKLPADHQRQSIQAALLKYKTIIAQLSDRHESIFLSTSALVANQGIVADGEALRQVLLKAARDFQQALRGYDPSGRPTGLQRHSDFPIDITNVKNQPDDLFDIKVFLTFERDAGLIDPSALNGHLPEVQKKVQQIQPNFSVPVTPDSKLYADEPHERYGVRNYVTQFEKTFAGFDQGSGQLRVLTRSGKDNLASTSDIAYLWAMRWSDDHGVSLDVSPDSGVAYFTMAPLSTKLFNQTAEVVHYNPNLDPEESQEAFSNIDLDTWAQKFLNVVEKVLSPELAAAVTQTDKVLYHALMLHKTYLAMSLTEGLIPVFDLSKTADAGSMGQDHRLVIAGDLKGAKELFEQNLLNLLTKAYSTSALVQVPVGVKVSGENGGNASQPPQLYGSLGDPTHENLRAKIPGTVPPKKEYTVTSARLKLETADQYLGFLIAAARPKAVKDLNLDLSYNVNYTEFMFQAHEDEYGYTPSSWLKFAFTDDKSIIRLSLGSFDIPVPLREYPNKPILIGQEQVVDSVQKSFLSKALETNPIEDALKWDFSSTVTRQGVEPQDALWVELTYNQTVAEDSSNSALSPKTLGQAGYKGDLESLFRALARFSTAYEGLEPWLDKLPQMVQGKSNNGDGPSAKKVVQVLVEEIANVSANWGAYRRIRDKNGNLIFPLLESEDLLTKDVPQEEVQTYVIEFPNLDDGPTGSNAADQKRLTVYVDSDVSDLPWINNQTNLQPLAKVPEGEGPSSDKTWYVTYYNEQSISDSDPGRLQLMWKNLEILKRQTANTKFWIVRNADLSGDASLETNTKLIYETDKVQFSNPVIPRVSVDHICLPEGQALEKSLDQILKPLMEAGTVVSKNRSIMMHLDYKFALSQKPNRASDDGVMSNIPILLVDNVKVKALGAGNEAEGIDLHTFVGNLSADINTWHKATNCLTNCASIFVDVTLFAGIEGIRLPLVFLNQIVIPVPPGWWISKMQ